MKKTIREYALEMIEKIETKGAYSHLLMNDVLKNEEIKTIDKALLTELVYSTISRKITLDFFLEPFLKKNPERWVRDLLRLSVYQLEFLDKIPKHAILHEAGEIARKRGHEGITKFVNGVLRNVIRKGVPSVLSITDDVERLAIEGSLPKWLSERFIEQYGYLKAREIALSFLTSPHQSVRVNVTETNPKALIKEFLDHGVKAKASLYIPEALEIEQGTVARSAAFQKGKCTIQDTSSMLPAYVLELEKGMHVLDACAAPGGKTTHIAEKMQGTGMVEALDIHHHKTKLIRSAADRLNLLNIREMTIDARKANMIFDEKTFDRILVDAPCSGFGVLRRKPEIKYTKTAKDITHLASIQQEILEKVSRLLKINGILVYSTCTIDKEENRNVITSFLSAYPEFEEITVSVPKSLKKFQTGKDLQLLPTDIDSDGFYIAALKRRA